MPTIYWNPTYWTKPAEMRHVVTVEQKVPGRGSMGEEIETWTPFTQVWAKIWPVKGKEAEESRRETGKVATRFNTRFKPGITQGMRLKHGTRIFDIISAINIGEKNRELEIMTVETI